MTTEIEQLLAEAYQVVGVLAVHAGVLDDPAVLKILANLDDMTLIHDDVLPFVVPTPLHDLLREAMPHLPGELQRRVRAALEG